MVVNLNDPIKVKLTKYGEVLYERYYRTSFNVLTKDRDGYSEMQLHEFLSIYGCYFPFNARNILEDMNLIIEK